MTSDDGNKQPVEKRRLSGSHAAGKRAPSAKPRKYASINHPTIEAAVEGLYYYADKKKALDRLNKIRQTFVTRKADAQEQISEDPSVLTLWIRGFGVTDADEASGYRGHYACLRVVIGEDDLWTIRAEKIGTPLHVHPQRQRPNYQHPDWQHPILRAIKAGRDYVDYDQALGELETLHVDFPDVTIPSKGKLHLIIYEGRRASPITRKYLLEIQPIDGGKYQIVATMKEAPSGQRSLRQKRMDQLEEAMGAFTAKLKGERFKKK